MPIAIIPTTKYNQSGVFFFLSNAGIIFFSQVQRAHGKWNIQGYSTARTPNPPSVNHLINKMFLGPLDLVLHWFVIKEYIYDLE